MLKKTAKKIITDYSAPSLIGGIFLAVVLFLFNTALSETWYAWQTEEYSHGYLIPFVGLILLFNKAPAPSTPKNNSWLGFAGASLCIIAQILFLLAGIKGLQPLLLVCFALSYFVMIYGLRFSFSLSAPLGFFFFLAPLPKFLYYKLSFNMQLLSTAISVDLLQRTGISVYRDGNIIDLGITKLEVAEACNGLRYLFPLMALGYLLAYMYKASYTKRIVLFLSTVPITILMNSFRIYMIGLSANIWSPEIAEGIIHDIEGWVIFLGFLLVLGAQIALMQRIGKKGTLDLDALSLPASESLARFTPAPWQKPLKAGVIFSGLVLLTFAYAQAGGKLEIKPVPLQTSLSEFPMHIGTWHGVRGQLDQASLDVLGTDEYLLADYTNDAGDTANLYVLYYPKQDSTSNQAIHTPEVCIPGGGWEIAEHTQTKIQLSDKISMPINRLIIKKGVKKQLVYYWFFQGDNITLGVSDTRISIITRALLLRQTDGGMIRVMTNLNSPDSAKKRLKNFITDSYLPLKFARTNIQK